MALSESDLERLEPEVIRYDDVPLGDVHRTLLRAFEGVNDFSPVGLSAMSLGATDGANVLAFHHQVARNEFRKVIDGAREELTGFLSSIRDIGKGMGDVDDELAAQLRALQAIAAGTLSGSADDRSQGRHTLATSTNTVAEGQR